MWIDTHPYLFIYVLGCAIVPIVALFNVSLFWMIGWLTKGNVLRQNLKKLDPQDSESFGQKTIVVIVGVVVESVLSWVGVLVALWQTFSIFLKVVREVFVATPEAIKLLRFPLLNNPEMSRESVWAHVQALKIRGGEKQPDEEILLYSINSLQEEHPDFDRDEALIHLDELNVVNSSVISSALRRLRSSYDDLELEEET